MVFTVNETDFFIKLAELPSEVTTLIVGFLPKCMLPELLYFPPIREIVAGMICLDVNIIAESERDKAIDEPCIEYSKCICKQFQITLDDLRKGIRQCNIFPRSIDIR
ncbi:hypothetical protein MG3_01856 [Candida albicans P78048]|uniref:Uncharacterized protein n=1 Tax=Candida albicans P78048 TaxID=1094989 RepID=A0AB34PZ75_CANAX|nr:hypothetical protein MG3_01856 [Candida albicans P78048]